MITAPRRPFSAMLRHILFLAVLGTAMPSFGQVGSLQLQANVPNDVTYKLRDRVPWSFTVNPRGSGAYAGGATWIVYVAGQDIYQNPIYIQVATGTVPPIFAGENYEVANQFWSVPNDGTLFNVESGYQFVVALYDIPPIDVLTLDAPGLSVAGRLKIDVIANLAVPSPAVIYPGPDQRQFFRGGDIVQFQTYWFNNARGETTGNGRVQSRPLRGRDRYSVDLRLTSNPALNIAALPTEETPSTTVPDEDDQLPEVTDAVNDDFKLMRIFLAADLGPGFSPDGFSQIRRVEVTGTPPGTSSFGLVTGALDPYGLNGVTGTARSYDPQPYDGFLDVGEQVSIVSEQQMPNNYVGRYFVALRVAMTNPDLDAAAGNNVFVSNAAPKIELVAGTAPTMQAVSAISSDLGVFVEGGSGASDYSSVSESGTRVAFESAANNLLVPPPLASVFVAARGGGANFADPANYPASGAGVDVDFAQVQPYLTTGRQVFVKYTQTGEVLLASRQAGGVQANADALNPWITASGRYVAFESKATNLVPTSTGGRSAIYVFDTETLQTVLVSVNANRSAANGDSFRPRLSSSGRFVVFESVATNLDVARTVPANSKQQVYMHDRDIDGNGVFDEAGLTATYLVSINSSNAVFNAVCSRPVVNLNDSAVEIAASGGRMFVAFTSWATNTQPAQSNSGYSMVYRAAIDVTNPNLSSRGARPSELSAVSLSPNGSVPAAVGYDLVGSFIRPDCDQAAINGDGSVIAFVSGATSFVLNPASGNYTPTYPNGSPLNPFLPPVPGIVPGGDYNRVPDVFVRDLRTEVPGSPNVSRVSVSNERVATGVISFISAGAVGNVPDSQPLDGDTVAISDGTKDINGNTKPPVVFTFRDTPVGPNDIQIGANVQATRDNLITAINLAFGGTLLAEPTTPPNVLDAAGNPAPGLGYNASIYIKNATPGVAGNVPIAVTLVPRPLGVTSEIIAVGMRGGGRQAEDDALAPGEPGAPPVQGVPFGSGQPSIDREGNFIAFRTIATNLDVYEETVESVIPALPPFPGYPRQQVDLYPAQEKTLITGELIRPLIFPTANVYLHDRGADRTERVSVSKFGYPTVIFGTQPGGINANTSAANHSPAISADGRFIAYSSDSTGEGGLIFRDNNLSWPAGQPNVRNVFVHDRQLVGESPPDSESRPEVQFLTPAPGLSVRPGTVITVEGAATPKASKTIQSVRLTVNGVLVGTALSSVPYTWQVPLNNPGTYNLLLVAVDSRGVESSASLTVTAVEPTVPLNPAVGSNEKFVVDYFQKIFFRRPSYAEYVIYLNKLNSGVSQAQTIVDMMQSPEYASAQNVLFGYFLRMGLSAPATTTVTSYLFSMTNGTNAQLIPQAFLPMYESAGILPPYGATVGQALVAETLLNSVNAVGTNLAVRSMTDSQFRSWMLRSFNKPYLPQAYTNAEGPYSMGSQTAMQNNIAGVPATNNPVVRFGYNYAYMSAFYARMVAADILDPNMRTWLTNFNAEVQGIALNYSLAPGNPWVTNTAPLSTNLAASLLPPVLTNTGTNTLTRGVAFTNVIPVGGQNLRSNTVYSFLATNFPASVSVSISNNPVRYFVRGTFTNTGTFPLTLIASNGPGLVGSNRIVYQVLPLRPQVVATVIDGAVGEPLTYALSALNTPATFTVARLPAGLSLNPSSGALSGIPIDNGVLETKFSASNAGGSAEADLTFSIRPPSPMVEWLAEHGLRGFDAYQNADPDRDGHSNTVEFAFGMRPDQADAIPFRYEFSGNSVTFFWSRRIGSTEVNYQILHAPSLAPSTWQQVTGVSPQVVAPEPGMVLPRGYERVSATVVRTQNALATNNIFYRMNATLTPAALRAP